MELSKPEARSGRRLPAIAAGATIVAALLLCAQEGKAIEPASSLNPVGSGARAAGMGGAFIGIADDATAASWNPAGLVQLEKPEFSIAYGYFNRQQSFSSSAHPELTDTDQGMDAHGINYASFAYPFTLFGKNMIASINYQRLIDMNKEYNVPNFYPNSPDTTVQLTGNTFKQTGYISTITPAFAIQVMPELYLGVAVNFWGDFLGTSSWENFTSGTSSVQALPAPAPRTVNTLSFLGKYSFSGNPVSVTPGFMLNLNKLTVGGVFKSPFKVDIDISGDNPGTETWDMPMSAGLGLAYRFSDTWTSSLDVYWTQWSAFVARDSNGVEFNPIVGNDTATVGRLKDTTQVRVGTEYLFIRNKMVFPVRAGLFYDPQPGFHNGAEKVDDYFGFSLGSGVTYGKYSFDLAYQFRRGSKISAPELDGQLGSVNSDTTQHTLLTSLIYRF